MSTKPQVLILASRFDLACDYIVAALLRRNTSYVRLNSEDLTNYKVELDPALPFLSIGFHSSTFEFSESSLRSVYYRRPVYLREYGLLELNPEELLSKIHWATFVRNLMLFENVLWVNHPKNTYFAEHKALQLRRALLTGFDVPRTRITNTVAGIEEITGGEQDVAVKGLDTVLFRNQDRELFGYTQLHSACSLSDSNIESAPVILQQALMNKLDIRVTVVGDEVFAVDVRHNGKEIAGDWRLKSREAQYTTIVLPLHIQHKCVELVKSLGLHFGAIDLAKQNDRYFFLEINPTGEWCWLLDSSDRPIDDAIATLLTEGRAMPTEERVR